MAQAIQDGAIEDYVPVVNRPKGDKFYLAELTQNILVPRRHGSENCGPRFHGIVAELV
jgi:hypothetical protein